MIDYPPESFDARQKFHPIYAAFLASKIHDLFVGQTKVIGKMDDRRATRLTPWIFVAGAVGIDVNGSGIKHQGLPLPHHRPGEAGNVRMGLSLARQCYARVWRIT